MALRKNLMLSLSKHARRLSQSPARQNSTDVLPSAAQGKISGRRPFRKRSRQRLARRRCVTPRRRHAPAPAGAALGCGHGWPRDSRQRHSQPPACRACRRMPPPRRGGRLRAHVRGSSRGRPRSSADGARPRAESRFGPAAPGRQAPEPTQEEHGGPRKRERPPRRTRRPSRERVVKRGSR